MSNKRVIKLKKKRVVKGREVVGFDVLNKDLERLRRTGALNSIGKTVLPGRISLRIAFLVDALNKVLEIFSKEVTKLAEIYCDKDEEGNPIRDNQDGVSFSGENLKPWSEAFEHFLEDTTFIPSEKPTMNLTEIEEECKKAGLPAPSFSPDNLVILHPFINIVEGASDNKNRNNP